MTRHGTNIEWTHKAGYKGETWNFLLGCTVVSEGCRNCYAARFIHNRGQHNPKIGERYKGLTRATADGRPVFTGKLNVVDHMFEKPLKWRARRMIFVNSLSDLFHEDVADEVIDKAFAVMALCPQHIFIVLTKRPRRLRHYLSHITNRDDLIAHTAVHLGVWDDADGIHEDVLRAVRAPLPNVWLGVSAEDQATADERIPYLLATPAAVRVLSAEPLLGPIDLSNLAAGSGAIDAFTLDYKVRSGEIVAGPPSGHGPLSWVICGGESGPGARPPHPDWVRSIRDQCVEANVPFMLKQWGEFTPGVNVERRHGIVDTATWFNDEWVFDRENLAREDTHIDDEPDLYRVGKKAAGRVLDGQTWEQYP